MTLDPGKKKQLLQQIKTAYDNIDPEDAARFAETLPELSITEVKPGETVAVHFPTQRPKPATSEK